MIPEMKAVDIATAVTRKKNNHEDESFSTKPYNNTDEMIQILTEEPKYSNLLMTESENEHARNVLAIAADIMHRHMVVVGLADSELLPVEYIISHLEQAR